MSNIIVPQLQFGIGIMVWTKFKVPGHFVVFSNTRLWEKETNMVVASHIWWLAKLAWYDVTRKPSIASKFFSIFEATGLWKYRKSWKFLNLAGI